jgi:hypothetical protein
MILVERLIAQMRSRPELEIDLLLFDPNPPGSGLHGVDQPDYLMLNTVAGQLTFYPHPDTVKGEAPHLGPTLDEWCRARGTRITSRGGVTTDDGGREVRPGDFLPRRLLGAYLEDCSRKLLGEDVPANVRIRRIAEQVVDARRGDTGKRYRLTTASGAQHGADSLFLSLGHGGAPRRAQRFRPERVGSAETVVISGLGLTAVDMVAALTAGRGGIYAGDTNQPRYLRSGREPNILLYSRSGLPFHARPDWSSKDAVHQVPPIFFDRIAVDGLRRKRPDGRLDFREDVLPLIALDMRAAYHITKTRLREGAAAAEDLTRSLMRDGAPEDAILQFEALDQRNGRFDPGRYLQTSQWAGDHTRYASAFSLHLQSDLRECIKGLSNSPLKAALEVWRNQRDTIRYAVNGDGLTSQSNSEFYRLFAPLSNRLVGGPQKERHAELLALICAGVVTPLPPQRPTPDGRFTYEDGRLARPEHHFAAHVGPSGLRRVDKTLLQSLCDQGLLNRLGCGMLDGIDVDAHGHPVGTDGDIDDNIWLLGPAVEGATFYNHYVGTPAPNCRLFIDAQSEVMRCLDRFVPSTTSMARRPYTQEASAP